MQIPTEPQKVNCLTNLTDRITRPFVTIMLVGVFSYGFLIEKISGETFGAVVISVTSFWFGQRSGELQRQNGNGNGHP